MTSRKRTREKIQAEVDNILNFLSQDEWKNFLIEKGSRHQVYYHYTSIETLKAILTSSHWRLTRADKGNDRNERPVHSASFTTSSLSSMGMWKMYAKLGDKSDFGVRIGIPKKTFKKIFTSGAWYRKDTSGNFVRFGANPKVNIYDVAYWHQGETEKTDVAFYRNYHLIGAALNYHFKAPLPEYFKDAIWRSEEEVRVCCDFSATPDVPDELYRKIEPEDFREMEFFFSPDIFDAQKIKTKIDDGSLIDTLTFFAKEVLCQKRLQWKSFRFPGEYEKFSDSTYLSK